MLTQLKQKRSEGFTIIEVMIVLAIAGLIILIVLLAVPALQRNSRNAAIKNDVSAVSGGLGEFASNNDGAVPTCAKSSVGTGVLTLLNATASASPTDVKIQGSTVVSCGDATTAQVTPDSGTIYVDFGANCGTVSGVNVTPVKQGRSTAIIYAIETSSGLQARCLAS